MTKVAPVELSLADSAQQDAERGHHFDRTPKKQSRRGRSLHLLEQRARLGSCLTPNAHTQTIALYTTVNHTIDFGGAAIVSRALSHSLTKGLKSPFPYHLHYTEHLLIIVVTLVLCVVMLCLRKRSHISRTVRSNCLDRSTLPSQTVANLFRRSLHEAAITAFRRSDVTERHK